MNLKRITKSKLKKLLMINGNIDIYIGVYKNNICFGTPYKTSISNIEELDKKLEEAKLKGWKGKLDIFVKN